MLSTTDEAGSIAVERNGVVLARYQAAGRTKPYFDTLALPAGAGDYAGRNLILDRAHDHVWHHGAWFVQKVVDGLNCWESELAEQDDRPHGLGKNTGYEVANTDDGVTINQSVEWRTSYGAPLLDDQRSITVHDPGADADGYFLTWSQRLAAAERTRHLHSESYHGRYGGLSLRFSRELTGGEVRLPDAENPDPNEEVTGRWCDYRGSLDGAARVEEIAGAGITIFDHPENERSSTYFTRREPFALLTANPIWHDVVVLEPDDSIAMDWGLWLHAGHPSPEELDDAYETYLELVG